MMEVEFLEARLPDVVATSEARAPISRSWSTVWMGTVNHGGVT
jgi:hypothetical protein